MVDFAVRYVAAKGYHYHGALYVVVLKSLAFRSSKLLFPKLSELYSDWNDTISAYSETSLIRDSMGPENNVGLGGCWIMECLLPYLCMVTVPHIMVGLERILDYRGVGLERFHCNILQ